MTQTAARLEIALIADPTEPHIRGCCQFFVEHGHRVRVIVPADVAPGTTTCAGAPVIRMNPADPRLPPPVRYVRAVRNIRQLSTWADVAHGHYLYPFGWLAGASGRPYAVTVWGSDIYRSLDRSRKDRLAGWLALRRAGIVTADSRDLAAAAIRAGAQRSRTHVVQFGVDLDLFSGGTANADLRRSLKLDRMRIVFSARSPTPLYRHEIVVEALADLPNDVALVLSGHRAEPGYIERLSALAERLGVAHRLRVVPDIPHEEMPEYFRLADVVVSIPESDATPLTLLEALACARPVVAGSLPSIREWSDGIHPSLLVGNPTPESVAKAISVALTLKDDEKTTLSRRGRQIVEERGDRQANMLKMERLYRTIVRRKIPWSTTAEAE